MEVTKIFLAKYYELSNAENMPIIKKTDLGGKASSLYQHVPEKEACKSVKGLLETIGEKSKPQ